MSYPKRGEIFLVNLDPTIGAEIKKTRPAVIIQNDVLNQYSPLVIICPLTSTIRAGETRVFVPAPEGGLTNDSMVLTQQVRCIDKRRLIKKLGKLYPRTMEKMNVALKITQGLLFL